MPTIQEHAESICFLARPELQSLMTVVRGEGYELLGPAVHRGCVGIRPIASTADLPHGVQDEQDGGYYRLTKGDPGLTFQCAAGQDSPKRRFFPANLPLFHIQHSQGKLSVEMAAPTPPKLAFLGIRPCDLAAIQVQDRTFIPQSGSPFCEVDPYYEQVRSKALLIVANCTRPGNTCFCLSMETGPMAREGFDLALTELHEGFVVQVGSARGKALVDKLSVCEPSASQLELANLRIQVAAASIKKQLNTEGLVQLLGDAVEHPRWDQVARRCLGCGNCTLVCPTCFCSTVVDSTDLSAGDVTRTRFWESCYTHQFSYTVSGPVRTTIRARYRHWLRHKLCTWVDQFGVSGCVGCGRCITWCPVGIDLTEETAAIRGRSS